MEKINFKKKKNEAINKSRNHMEIQKSVIFVRINM